MVKPNAKTFLRCVPALGWMLLIFMMSHQPGGESGAFTRKVIDALAKVGIDLKAMFGEDTVWVIRKAAHFSEYFILALLLLWALRPFEWPKRAWLAIAFTALYAATDEFHQLFIPKRVGDAFDVLIDSLGGATAVGLFALVRHWMLRRRGNAQHSLASQSR